MLIDLQLLLIAVEIVILAVSVVFAVPCLPETRHALAPAGDDVPAWRRRRSHFAGMGGDDTDAGAQSRISTAPSAANGVAFNIGRAAGPRLAGR